MELGIILEARKIGKRFPGVVALDEVDFDLRQGEVHVLLGQNGAGKSTLVNVMSGALQPDEGELRIHGKSIRFNNPRDALNAGIATVHQELTLVPYLSAAENVWLGQLPGKIAVMNWGRLWRDTQHLFDRLGVMIDPRVHVHRLGTAERQLVTIAKSLASSPEILIMDEPTSALTDRERENLFEIINGLKSQGIAIVYISHRLEEVLLIGTRITVLRDGRRIETFDKENVTRQQLVEIMVGHELETTHVGEVRTAEDTDPALEVVDLSTSHGLKNITFALGKGEILGIAGLMGAGRTELARALFGVDQLTEGTIKIHGRPVKLRSPKHAIKQGIGLLVEDRRQGLVLPMSVAHNITLADFRDIFPQGVLSARKERQLADEAVDYLSIRTPSIWQRVANLSGGNQQKVALARWICTHSNILILDEPTRGIDVGAKDEIYKLLRTMAKEGVSIIFIVSEFPELATVCDRALVMFNGEITGELEAGQMTQQRILALATGGGE